MIFGTPQIVTNGLVLHLDAGNGKSYVSGSTVWNDLSGLNNTMANTNSPTFTNNFGGGIVYNGSNQFSNISGTENQITSSAVTAEVICSVTSNTHTRTGGNSGVQYIVFRQNTRTASFEGYAIVYVIGAGTNPGTLSVNATSTAGLQLGVTSPLTSLGVPVVITATYDSSFIRMYVNGVFISQTATGFPLNYNTNHKLTLGRANAVGSIWDGYFNGIIYSYKQYNRTLSASEVAQNYNALKSRFGLS